MQRAFARKKRGPQKSPVKKLTTIRLSQDVLAALRSKGRGWQTLADETLRSAFVKER
ncbi:MAG TPA: BrnA antitoxin family protein [Acidobacteriaceae bacterium]